MEHFKFYCFLIVFFGGSLFSYSQTKEEVYTLHEQFKELRFVNFENAFQNAKKAVAISEQLADKKLCIISYNNLSEIYYLKKEAKEALAWNTKAKTLASEMNDTATLVGVYNLLGRLQKRKNNYVASLTSYKTALAYANAYSKKDIHKIKNNMARLYWAMDDLKNAKKTLQTNLNSAKKIKDSNALADAYNILGVLHLEKQKDSALFFYKKALLFTQKDDYLKRIIISNIGNVYLTTDNFNEALHYLKRAEKLGKKIGDKAALHYVNMALAVYFEMKSNYPEAIKKYKEAIETYGNFVDDSRKAEAYWIASGVFYHAEKYKEAYLYLESHLTLSEKIASLAKKKEFEELRTQYEVAEKNNQIILLEKEKELTKVRTRTLIISLGSLILLCFMGILFYRHRVGVQKKIRNQETKLFNIEKEQLKKEQALKKIEGYLEGQEKEKNRIAKELHDGIGGDLTGVHHLLHAINKEHKILKLANISKNIASITNEVRKLSHHLSGNYMTHQSFEVLLVNLKKNYEISKQFTISIAVFPKDCFSKVPEKQEHHLYRITQELLKNVSKHSQAKEVNLSFTHHKKYLSFIFEDDGIGFITNEKEKGIGLKNIEERITSLQGTVHIDSVSGKGTHIAIEIPIIAMI